MKYQDIKNHQQTAEKCSKTSLVVLGRKKKSNFIFLVMYLPCCVFFIFIYFVKGGTIAKILNRFLPRARTCTAKSR